MSRSLPGKALQAHRHDRQGALELMVVLHVVGKANKASFIESPINKPRNPLPTNPFRQIFQQRNPTTKVF